MKLKSTKKPINKKLLVVALSVLLVLVAGSATFAYFRMQEETEATPFGEQKVELERSEAEKEASRRLEENPETKLDNDQNDTPAAPSGSTSDGKVKANAILTIAGIYNGTVQASGMVTDVAETGGECTYTFTNGSTVVTKPSTTLVNPTSTTCKTVTFPASELTASGVWKVKVSYTSETYSAVSNETEITK